MRVMLTSLAASSMMYKIRQSPTRMRQWSLYPFSFLHPGGRGCSASAAILASRRANRASSSASSSLPAEGFISRVYLATPAIVLQSSGPVFLVGYALFLAARFGQEPVPEILPNCAMLLKINQHRCLAPL